MKNKFFNPADFPFEVFGFSEDFQDADTFKALGSRRLETPDRPCGSPGRRTYTLEAPLVLSKGYKAEPVTIRSGRRVIATIEVLCGKTK